MRRRIRCKICQEWIEPDDAAWRYGSKEKVIHEDCYHFYETFGDLAFSDKEKSPAKKYCLRK